MMMSALTGSLIAGATPAVAAAVGFVLIAVFQIALAAGRLSARRPGAERTTGSCPPVCVWPARAVGVRVLAALTVLGRAGFGASPLPASFTSWGTWLLVGVLAVGALMNFASPSAWGRFMWGPFTLILAVLCLLVARNGFAAPG